MADGNGNGDDSARLVRYVDLVLGAWRPREAAHQLAAGLGLALPPVDRGEAIGLGAVEVEAEGDFTVNRAWDDAALVAAALPAGALVVLLAPRFDLPLRSENAWFFIFLRRLGHTLVVVGKEPLFAEGKSPFERRRSVVAPDWEVHADEVAPEKMRLLRLFPGLVPRGIAEAADLTGDALSLIPAGPGHFLIPLGYRDRDPRTAPRDFDLLEPVEARDAGFKALAQSFCTAHFADPATLLDLAEGSLRSGSLGLALDLAARARTVARDPATVARAELLRQEIAILDRRFAEAAASPPLSPRTPPPALTRWQRAREWAAIASRDLPAAEAVVTPTLRRLGGKDGVDVADVMRLDLVAGARRQAGNIEGALTLSRSVAAALGRLDALDGRLVFANSLTLMRLLAERREGAALVQEIDRGFATSLGARTASEIVLMNVLRARAEPEATAEAARLAWLRAALVWLGHEPHEGLSRSAVEALVARAPPPAGLDDALSAAFAEALAAAWPETAAADTRRVPAIRSSQILGESVPQRMFGGPGAAVLWATDAVTGPPLPQPRARLARMACKALGEICPSFAKVDSGTVAVDTNLGVDVPRTREEALSVALRWKVEDFAFGAETRRLDFAERRNLASAVEARLAPIVGDVTEDGESLVVTFRRRLPPATLSGAEARLLAELRDKRHTLRDFPMVYGVASAELEPLLRRLEAARIVRLDVAASGPSAQTGSA